MTASIFAATGCGRGYVRSRTHKSGDRSVTIVKRPKAKGVPGRHKAVTSRKFNRVKKQTNWAL